MTLGGERRGVPGFTTQRGKLGVFVALVPTAAQADPSFYTSPLFGSTTTPGGSLLVADAGQGIVDGDDGTLVASLPGVTDVAAITDTSLWAITAGQDTETDSGQALWRVENGVPTMVAYVAQFDDASWAAVEIFGGGIGGSVHACDLATQSCTEVASDLPMLSSIAFRNDGSLWGTTHSLVPGLADAVQILP